MKLAPYPSYKPSGVERLGAVPEHWEVRRGRFCFEVNPPSGRLRGLSPDKEVSFVPMEAVGEYGGLSLDETRVIAEVGSGYTEFEDGDVVVAKITPCFENGKGGLAVNLVNGAAFGTTELHVLRASASCERRFLFYLTISGLFRGGGEAEMYGAGGQKRVPPEYCENFPTPLPLFEEQRAIADFLDRETAKIHTLVARERTLIERLTEKRTALISRTVSRGLPPDAATKAGLDPHPNLKPSRIDWLGDVPEHWQARRLGEVANLVNGYPFDSNLFSPTEGVPLIRIRDIDSDSTETLWAGPPVPDAAISNGDVLVGMDGDFNVAWWCGGPALLNQRVCCLRSKPSLLNQRLLYYSVPFPLKVLNDITYSTTVKHLSSHDVRHFRICLPDVDEQRAIADFLDRETAKIDQMAAKAEAAIERLQEYRTALITAAVTGKVDVRGATV